MGRALAESSPGAAAVWAEADAALGFPLFEALLRGAGRGPGPDRQHPARGAVRERGRRGRPGRARRHARPRGGPQPGRVLGARGRGRAALRGRGAPGAPPRRVHAGGGAGGHWRDGRADGGGAGRGRAALRRGRAGEVVGVANINSPGQIVIAGHRAAVERAVEAAAARGGRKSVLLPVSAPFHCALMKPAADRLVAELERVAVSDPRIPVVRNVDAGVTRTADEVKPFLVQQVASPVRWTDCMERLAREGATGFLEVGPGRVLTGLLSARSTARAATRWRIPRRSRRPWRRWRRERVTEGKALAGKVAIVTGAAGASASPSPGPWQRTAPPCSLWPRRGASRRGGEGAGGPGRAGPGGSGRCREARRRRPLDRGDPGALRAHRRVVNNAGITRDQLLVRMKDDDWTRCSTRTCAGSSS